MTSRDVNDVLREQGEDALREQFDKAPRDPDTKSKARGKNGSKRGPTDIAADDFYALHDRAQIHLHADRRGLARFQRRRPLARRSAISRPRPGSTRTAPSSR